MNETVHFDLETIDDVAKLLLKNETFLSTPLRLR